MESRTTFIFETATSVNQMKSNSEVAKFEAFNPNGLVARKEQNDAVIDKLVEAGTVPAGWVFAYGDFSYARERVIQKLALKQRVNAIALDVARKMLKEQIEQQEAKIAEVAA